MDTSCTVDAGFCSRLNFFTYVDLIKLYYWCIVLNILLVLISIFGKIKEQYKWFVLNHCLFEVFYLIYYARCGVNPVRTPSTFCFSENSSEYLRSFPYFIFLAFTKTLYWPMLLLTITRFVSLYFPLSFDRIFNSRTLLPVIIGFDFIWLCFVGFHSSFNYLVAHSNDGQVLATTTMFSLIQEQGSGTLPSMNQGQESSFWSQIPLIIMYISHLFLVCGIIMIFMIVFKILYRVKKQRELNQKTALWDSFRVAIAILIHNFTLLHALIIADGYLVSTILPLPHPERLRKLTEYFDFPIQIYIFVDSFVLLVLLSGYRKALFGFAKYTVKKLKIKRENRVDTTRVTVATKTSTIHVKS